MTANAERVWDSVDDARAFLSTSHAMLGGKRPIEVALTELGAEQHDANSMPAAWDHAHLRVARVFGDTWIRGLRTAVLVVPSEVARRESHVLINPRPADFSNIVADTPEAVVWDARLFAPR